MPDAMSHLSQASSKGEENSLPAPPARKHGPASPDKLVLAGGDPLNLFLSFLHLGAMGNRSQRQRRAQLPGCHS